MYLRTCTYMCTYIHILLYICAVVYIYMYIYIYIYIYIHITDIYIYTSITNPYIPWKLHKNITSYADDDSNDEFVSGTPMMPWADPVEAGPGPVVEKSLNMGPHESHNSITITVISS